MDMNRPDYNLSQNEVLERYSTFRTGLSPEEARNRLERYGENKLAEGRKKTALEVFIDQFKDHIVWILIAAAAVLAAACIAILVILMRRRRKSEPQPAPEQPASDSRSGIYMRLEMISGRHTGANELSLTEELTIGSAKTCSLIVEAPGVEPLHARIFVRGGLIYLEDLGSAGGTLLGGMRLQGPNRLRSGDEITVGGARFCLKF